MIVPRERLLQIKMIVMYVGRPLLILVLYDVSVVVAYKVFHLDWVALPHIPLTSVWFGDWGYCGVSEPVVVRAMVGGADALGRAGEQLAKLGAAGDDGDDAVERSGGRRDEGVSAAAGVSRDCVRDCAAATPEGAGAVGGIGASAE